MIIRERTAYLVECDYKDCGRPYDFYDLWSPTKEHKIETVIADDEWLCLFTGDNKPRLFCPLHLRYMQNSPDGSTTVFFDSDSPATQTTLHALNRFYEEMSTPQPLPKLECEDTILAVLTSEDANMKETNR